MLANYHTHTFRCRHAVGQDREYVETAVARGLQVLGFSDHVPMVFADGHESNFRVPVGQLEDYVNSVLSLRDEFKADIDVRLGFEMEYYPDTFEDTWRSSGPIPWTTCCWRATSTTAGRPSTTPPWPRIGPPFIPTWTG